EELYTLVVVSDNSVAGSPVPGAHEVAPGTRIDYSYRAAVGYDSVSVLLDNSFALDSGSFTMTSNRILVVGGHKSVHVSSEDEGIVQIGSAVFFSSDARRTYFQYVKELESIFANGDVESARERLGAVNTAIFQSGNDAVRAEVSEALRGSVFEINGS